MGGVFIYGKICKRCGETLPLKSLRKFNHSLDRNDTCNNCRSDLQDSGYRLCAKCDVIYPLTLEYFRLDKDKILGLDYTCIFCRNKRTTKWNIEICDDPTTEEDIRRQDGIESDKE